MEDSIREKKTDRKGNLPAATGCGFIRFGYHWKFKFDACIGRPAVMRKRPEQRKIFFFFFFCSWCIGQWGPKLQRPELWNIYNGRIHKGWKREGIPHQQLDRNWMCGIISKENIPLPSIYFSHYRDVIAHEGQLVAVSDYIQIDEKQMLWTRGALPHRRRYDLHGGGWIKRRNPWWGGERNNCYLNFPKEVKPVLMTK